MDGDQREDGVHRSLTLLQVDSENRHIIVREFGGASKCGEEAWCTCQSPILNYIPLVIHVHTA